MRRAAAYGRNWVSKIKVCMQEVLFCISWFAFRQESTDTESRLDFLETAAAPFFQEAYQVIEKHRHNAQEDDTHQEPIHFKYLAWIYNQISQPISCRQELSDNHPNQTQSYIYLHIADDCGDGAWQHHLWQRMETVAAQGIDKFDFAGVDCGEAGIKA